MREMELRELQHSGCDDGGDGDGVGVVEVEVEVEAEAEFARGCNCQKDAGQPPPPRPHQPYHTQTRVLYQHAHAVTRPPAPFVRGPLSSDCNKPASGCHKQDRVPPALLTAACYWPIASTARPARSWAVAAVAGKDCSQ